MKRVDCRVYYDKTARRLIYFGSNADEDHWEAQWAEQISASAVRRVDPFVVKQTRAVLKPGARVLDAGCGLSQTVWGLKEAGFDAYGVDYAEKTIEAVQRLAPELNVRAADVRQLPFADGYFDSIWSLGVVEHFYEGFDDIVDEMWRPLRPGGFAFVTVPTMSPLRRFKAFL